MYVEAARAIAATQQLVSFCDAICFILPAEVTAGSHATNGCEPRQTRKGAAAATLFVCRGSAWLSLVSVTFPSASGVSPHVVHGSGAQVAPPAI